MDDGNFETNIEESLLVHTFDHDGTDESGIPVRISEVVVFFADQEFFDYTRQVSRYDVLRCGFNVYYRVECAFFLVDRGEFPNIHVAGRYVGYLFADIGLFCDRSVYVDAHGLPSGGSYRNSGRFGSVEFYRRCWSEY